MNYRGFTLAELEQEYSPSSMIGGDLTPQLMSYRALSKTARERLEVKENLPYGPDPAQVLDFFPATQAGAPLHIFVHGGYWQALNQRDSAMMAPAIVKSGAAFATLNYTLAPEARLSQMIAECRDALLWLASQAGQLGFDPTRVMISGHSAGAHLVAMLLSKHGTQIAEAGLTIERAILISGVYDLEPVALTSVNEPLKLSEAEIRGLSPLGCLPQSVQHVHVTVAQRDTAEFIRQSRSYAEHLRKNGQSVSFDLKRGQHHFDIILHADCFVT